MLVKFKCIKIKVYKLKNNFLGKKKTQLRVDIVNHLFISVLNCPFRFFFIQ